MLVQENCQAIEGCSDKRAYNTAIDRLIQCIRITECRSVGQTIKYIYIIPQ